MELVEEYGIDVVLADKLKLVELRIDQFLKHFSSENISKDQQNILCLLASYSPLPLTVIASSFSKEMKDISNDISRLINLSFVVVEDKLYRVSDPIEDAAIKAFGLPEAKAIKSLANAIFKLIDEPGFDEPRLNLHRILYRASWYIRDEDIKNRVIYLFNDLMKIIKTLYDNDRNYSGVIEATEIALMKTNNKSDYEIIFSYRAKSFIYQEKWQEAEQEIKKMKEHAPLRNVYYLYGFLNRKQRKNQEAINAYLESQKCGRNDEALNRELGHCYFFIGDYQKANEYVQKVLQSQKHHKRVNFYALDLQAQIAIALGDKEVANQSIALLQDIDESAYYYRKSRFEFLLGDKYKAEKDAENARKLSKNNNPRFQTLAHLTLCHITTGEIDKAQNVINEIDQKFGSINLDIRKGLRAKLAIARNRYEDALSLSNEIKDKSSKSYKSIRRFALHGYLNNCAMSDSERTKCETEFMKLKAESVSIEEVELTPEIDSYFELD
jgi:tetratricopeptide (TPR) repeat protein